MRTFEKGGFRGGKTKGNPSIVLEAIPEGEFEKGENRTGSEALALYKARKSGRGSRSKKFARAEWRELRKKSI